MGKYCVSAIVAPKFYQKLTLDSNGTLKKEFFNINNLTGNQAKSTGGT